MDIVSVVTTLLPQILGEALDQLARDCGLVVRQRKFSGQNLLQMLVITLLHKPDADAWDFLLTAQELHIDVTQTAVEKRFAAGQPLVDFLRQALETALRQAVAGPAVAAELLHRFDAVLVGDSTTILLPDELADRFAGCGGSDNFTHAAVKIQVLWEIKTGPIVQLHVGPARDADATSPIAIDRADAGTLLVYDPGYFDLSRFAALDRQGARFLSRLQHGTTVFDSDGNELDLVAFLRGQSDSVLDVAVELGVDQRLACRLIAVRVPEEVANRRRQKAAEKARKKGRVLSAAYAELLGWSLFVTNSPAAELTVKAVLVLYRARWQIELLFKLWKSHNGLGRCRAKATALERLAVFYAKLLGVVLQHWLLLATAWLVPGRSLRKSVRVLREWVKRILLAVAFGEDVAGLVRDLGRMVKRLGAVRKRRGSPSTDQLLNDPELLDWI